MGQIEDLRVFVDIVNKGGIARAAEAMNIAKSAVSRRLKLMEDRYGVQLVDRKPGVWEVSTAGRELFQRALRVLAEADDIEADFAHARQSLAGPLMVSIPREFGLGFLQPILLDFAARHPEIQLTADFDDRRVDLDHENYDLAIRITEEEDPGLIVRRIGGMRHRLYASAGYETQKTFPKTVEELREHPLLHYGATRRARWEFETDDGPQSLDFQPVLNSNSGQFLLAAARAGQGIARLPEFIAASALRAGALAEVLPDVRFRDRGIVLAYSGNRLVTRRMRVFIEDISAACLGL